MLQDTVKSISSDIAIVALGGNLPSDVGDPKQTIKQSLKAISASGLEVLDTSHFYQTPCFPAGAGPDFVNAAATISGAAGPEELLEVMHRVERQFGRTRKTRWAGRTLDLDLLAFGDIVCPDLNTFNRWLHMPLEQQKRKAPEGLILPHPRIQERAFVLVPACDVAPDWRHPVLGQTLLELKNRLNTTEIAAISVV